MTSHLRAVADAIPLIAFRAAAGGMPILLGLFIANRWGLEDLAAFTVANALIAVAAVIADWGATRALPRNLATLPAGLASQFLGSANALRLLLLATLAGLGLAAVAAGLVDQRVLVYLAILFPLCPLAILTTNALSERVVTMQMRPLGLAVAAGLVVFGALGVMVLVLRRGPHWLAGAYVIGKLVEALVIASGRWWVVAVRATALVSTARALWPFSLQMIIGVTYPRLAVFTVERATTRPELGVFSVAVALQSALLLVPASLALIHFPELTRRMQASDGRGVRRILVRYTIVSGIGVALGVMVLSLFIAPIGDLLKVPRSFAPLLVGYASLAFLTIFSMMLPFLMQARGHETLAGRLSVVTLFAALAFQIVALSSFGLWGILPGQAAAEIIAIAVFGVMLRRSTLRFTGERVG